MLVGVAKGDMVKLKIMMGGHFTVSQWGVIRKHNLASAANTLLTSLPLQVPRTRTRSVQYDTNVPSKVKWRCDCCKEPIETKGTFVENMEREKLLMIDNMLKASSNGVNDPQTAVSIRLK